MKHNYQLDFSTVHMSNHMRAYLREFDNLGRNRGIKVTSLKAASMDERTLWAMIDCRKYLRIDETTNEYRITELGEAVRRLDDNTEVYVERKTPKLHYGQRMQQLSSALRGTLQLRAKSGVVTPINKHKARRRAA